MMNKGQMFRTVMVLVTMTSLAVRAVEQRSNILFIIADDVSQASLGAYGCRYIKTPNIDRLVREGARFENAFCCNPKCAPARVILVTGRYSWQLEEAANLRVFLDERRGGAAVLLLARHEGGAPRL